MTDKPLLSPDIQKWMEDELFRIQVEMYERGKIDCLKSLLDAIDSLHESIFTKASILMLIQKCKEELEKRKND